MNSSSFAAYVSRASDWNLADPWLTRGQPQQGVFYLERVVKTFPGTRQAEVAQVKLARLQGPSTRTPEPKK